MQKNEVQMSIIKKKWVAIFVLMMTNAMLWLDATILPVALPTIQSYFHSSIANLQWMVNIYLLALPLFVVVAGKAGDILGHRKILSFGILLFAFSSLFCGFSQSSGQLIIARFFQGVGAAMIVPTATGILYENIPEKKSRSDSRNHKFLKFLFYSNGSLGRGFYC